MFMIQRKSLFKTISTAKHLFNVSHRIHAEIQDLKSEPCISQSVCLACYKHLQGAISNFAKLYFSLFKICEVYCLPPHLKCITTEQQSFGRWLKSQDIELFGIRRPRK